MLSRTNVATYVSRGCRRGELLRRPMGPMGDATLPIFHRGGMQLFRFHFPRRRSRPIPPFSLSPRFIYLFIYRIPLMLYLCQIIRASSSISKNPTRALTLPPPGGAVRVIDAQWNVSSNYNFRSKAVVNEFINRPKLEWNRTETALKLHWGWSGAGVEG